MPANDNDNKVENATTNIDLDEAKEEIEEQYRILKEEEEQEERRKAFILIVLFFLVFTISFTGAAFSYITYKRAVENEANSSLEESNGSSQNGEDGAREIIILYNTGTEFVAEDIIPGWESTGAKDFTVSNTGTIATEFNVVFTNIETTFVTLEDLLYTIKRNGEVIAEDVPVPASEQVVLQKQTIAPGAVDTYELFFKFVETGTVQNENAEKTYKMRVMVTAEEN